MAPGGEEGEGGVGEGGRAALIGGSHSMGMCGD